MFAALRIALACWAALLPAVAQSQDAAEAATRQSYRVGIVAYDDVRSREQSMQRSFAQIATLRFASGTAEEVLNWVTNGLVDIAVLSPGALVATGAVMRNEERNKRIEDGTYPAWDARYLITPAQLGSRNPFAAQSRRGDGGYEYEAQVIVDRGGWQSLKQAFPGTDEDTLRAANKAHKLQFVFGDPLSLSGTIVPRAQLQALGIDFESRWEFGFGHKDTIELLLNDHAPTIGNEKRERIGFIFDGSIPGAPPGMAPDLAAEHVQRMLERMASELMPLHIRRPPEPAAVVLDTGQGQERLPLRPALQAAGNSLQPLNDLPVEVWVVRPGFGTEATRALRDKLLALRSAAGVPLFADQNDEQLRPNPIDETAARVRLWAHAAGIDLGRSESGRAILFPEIIHSMRHFERRFGTSARLALVLSGGGAKCAYQAGVIESIEQQLQDMKDYQLHASNTSAKIGTQAVAPDISLVVGTSGGALNALPTAVGITAKNEPAARTMLTSLWASADLVRILDVYWQCAAAIGLVFAMVLWFAARLLLAIATSVGFGLLRLSRYVRAKATGQAVASSATRQVDWLTSWKILLFVMAACALAILAFLVTRAVAPELIARGMPTSRGLYYWVWLPLNVGSVWTVGWLVAIVIAVRLLPAPLPNRPRFASWLDRTVHISGVSLILVMVLICASLFAGASLVQGAAMREVVLDSMRKAMGNQVRRNECGADCGAAQEESALSAAITSDELTRKRDLVITVTMLNEGANADRYVYLAANSNGALPDYEQRALALGQSSHLAFLNARTNLVPFLIASGSVFPFFPPKSFQDPLGMSRTVKVVDGGFAHNSPVEAALDWGATHIIVVEASPSLKLDEQENFASNLSVAFDHLFEQAQMTDHRSRERVEIYYIRPRRELLKTLEFIPGVMRQAIEEGKRDMRAGRLVQFSRPPVFSQVSGGASAPN